MDIDLNDEKALMAWAEDSPNDAGKVALILDEATRSVRDLDIIALADTRYPTETERAAVKKVVSLALLLTALGRGYEVLLAERDALLEERFEMRQLARHYQVMGKAGTYLDDLEEDDYARLEELCDRVLGVYETGENDGI